MRILFAGGGTAGHINPALSIAAYAKKKDKDTQILFIGKKGNMEEKLVGNAGFDIEFIDIEGIKRKLTLDNIRVAVKAFAALSACKRILKRFSPDVVICTGGYVSGPVMHAAHALHIPCIIHEQNVFPGVTVKLSARYADVIATSFEQTAQYIKQRDKCIFTGNPVRADVLTADRQAARTALGADGRPFILAFGGSLGAQRINEAIAGYIRLLDKASDVQLLFGTGVRGYDEVMKGLVAAGVCVDNHPGIRIEPYIYNMNEAMAAADIVISRAGAITISEITALGKAAILIPSPNVAHNHQYENARLLEKHHAALLIADADLTAGRLKEKIDALLKDKALLASLGENAKKMGVTDAAEKIYEIALRLCRK